MAVWKTVSYPVSYTQFGFYGFPPQYLHNNELDLCQLLPWISLYSCILPGLGSNLSIPLKLFFALSIYTDCQ